MLMTKHLRALVLPTFSLMNTRNGNVRSEHHECNVSERSSVLTQQPGTIVLSATASLGKPQIERKGRNKLGGDSNETFPLPNIKPPTGGPPLLHVVVRYLKPRHLRSVIGETMVTPAPLAKNLMPCTARCFPKTRARCSIFIFARRREASRVKKIK
jgi:hypothetical protein